VKRTNHISKQGEPLSLGPQINEGYSRSQCSCSPIIIGNGLLLINFSLRSTSSSFTLKQRTWEVNVRLNYV
jgi:hypothetical protein